MNLIRMAIKRPTAVIAAVLMVVVFGVVALETIPIQLTPDVQRPVIQITTIWPGAAPVEVEREITTRLEEELTGIEGLTEITSTSQAGRSRITLEFTVDQDLDRAFLLVSNRLGGISDLPSEATEPAMRTSGSDDRPIARLGVRRVPGNTRDIETYGDFVTEVLADRLERVPGVSQVDLWGGSERELRIVIAPEKMARYGLGVSGIVSALRDANASISAGSVDEGKRRYVVRPNPRRPASSASAPSCCAPFRTPRPAVSAASWWATSRTSSSASRKRPAAGASSASRRLPSMSSARPAPT